VADVRTDPDAARGFRPGTKLQGALFTVGAVQVESQVVRRMASNRIGIVELLLGLVVVYAAYNLLLYATHTPHVHGDDPTEVRTSEK
jgi:hypothetical protein